MYSIFKILNRVSTSLSLKMKDAVKFVGNIFKVQSIKDAVSFRGNVTWIGTDVETGETTTVSAHNDLTDLGIALFGASGLELSKYPELTNCDKLIVVKPNMSISGSSNYIQSWGTDASALTQVLVGGELGATPSTRIAPIYTSGLEIDESKIIAYASNNRVEEGNIGCQNPMKTVSDVLSPYSTTTSKLYPAECGIGEIKGILMMPGFKDGKKLRGYSIWKGIDRYDPANSAHGKKTTYMIKNGVTGLTGANEVILGGYTNADYNTARYIFNFETGKYSDVPMSQRHIELPYANSNQIVAGNYLYFAKDTYVYQLNLTTFDSIRLHSMVSSSNTLFSDGTYGYYSSSANELKRFTLGNGVIDDAWSLNTSAMNYKNYWGTSDAFDFRNFAITNFEDKYMVVHTGGTDWADLAGVVITDFNDLQSLPESVNFYPACKSLNYSQFTVGGKTGTYAFDYNLVSGRESQDGLSIGGTQINTNYEGVFINLLSGNLISYQVPEGGTFNKTDTTYLEVLYTYGVNNSEA